ncbi:ImmA/IrrE family metallo-endopeptidase [uncultured Helicobacter sp.]|uniref:ImmA/IrrE family metallo-endopeptidase n=1 Tax=uncultured Helicobacter sp. TaxID=175537 RepID=UPI00260EBAE1|nr:ImmA/IrrE family metallo-endopeptidase [uncultured Helicobacter sp.]
MSRESQIATAANQARMLVNQLFPIDPILIAKAMGLEVFTAALPRNVSGQIFYKEKKIFVEQTDFITRQIFSVAHELGHYMLHNDGTSHTSLRDTTTSQGIDVKEIEANCFAANLLMPKDEVLRLVGLGFAVDSMASYFGVSPIAMEYRLSNLGVSVYV